MQAITQPRALAVRPVRTAAAARRGARGAAPVARPGALLLRPNSISSRSVRVAAGPDGGPVVDAADLAKLEAEAEEFMRKQAAEESGVKDEIKVAAPMEAKEVKVVTSGITDEDCQRYLNEIFEVVQGLNTKRNMNTTEIKLTLMIEDPKVAERRRKLGIEEETGVSREELAAAFEVVVAGGVPEDRLALKVLAEEMAEWPFLDGSSGRGEAPSGRSISALEEASTGDEKDTAGMPDFVGYGLLYGISGVPVIIGITAVTILFVNSLR